jgi:hypothetical protein
MTPAKITTSGPGFIEMIRDVADVRGRVERNPYLMMAGGIGAGFILGGGMFTRLADRLAGLALRLAVVIALPRLQEELGRCAVRATDDMGFGKEKGEYSRETSRSA